MLVCINNVMVSETIIEYCLLNKFVLDPKKKKRKNWKTLFPAFNDVVISQNPPTL